MKRWRFWTYTNKFSDNSGDGTDGDDGVGPNICSDPVVVENNGGGLTGNALDIGDDTVQHRLDVVNDRGHLRGRQVIRLHTLYS